MKIFEMITGGLRIARTSRALWLYGFFVGLGTAVNAGNNGHVPGAPAAHVAPRAFTGGTGALAIGVLALVAAGVFMYFVSEGALIDGVTRVRRGKVATVREGWRDGLAHWGVLLRIAVVYFAMSIGSLLLLAAPYLLALKLAGTALAVIAAIAGALIAVPWLATLYIWQAFASRIAVLEDRRARDALGKAWLFLHGRLLQGLKLAVAAFLGRLFVMLVGAIGLVAIGLVVVGVLKAFGLMHATVPVIVLGSVALLPPAFILVAVSGLAQSGIWTLGYLVEQEK